MWFIEYAPVEFPPIIQALDACSDVPNEIAVDFLVLV